MRVVAALVSSAELNGMDAALRCPAGFAGGFSSRVMLGCYIRYGSPLRLAVYSIERLVTGVRERKETVRPPLDRRYGRGCQAEDEQEKDYE